MALLDPGDELVMCWPSFISHRQGTAMQGATWTAAPLRADGSYDLDALLAQIGPATKMSVVVSPNNPTGGVVGADELEAFLDALPAQVLPVLDDEDPEAVLEAGGTPALPELRLHNGTVWRWNRPVYDVVDDVPHLRVENRVLPGGPTVVDILANGAFYFGALRALDVEMHLGPLRTFQRPFVFKAELVRLGAAAGTDFDFHRWLIHDAAVNPLQPVIEPAQLVATAVLGIKSVVVSASMDAQLLVF
jgi:hypothetical protein